jgi:hypothetical protein
MELVKSLTWYDIYFVKYVSEYWIINREIDAKEAVAENLSMALAKSEALDESLSKFISEGKYEKSV